MRNTSDLTMDADPEDVIDDYIDGLEYGESRESDIYQVWEWALNEQGTGLFELTQRDLEDWASDLDDDGYAGVTIREKISSVRGLYNTAYRDYDFEWPVPRRYYYVDDDDHPDHIQLDDYALAPQHTIDNPKSVMYIETAEYHRMLDECDMLRDELLLRILWDTGIRASEAASIQKSHLDLENNSVEVKNYKIPETAPIEDQWRTVYYTEPTAVRIREWKDRGVREKYKHAGDSPYLLLTLRSPQMDHHSINRRVRKLAKRSGVQEDAGETADGRQRVKVTSHCLRHSFAVHRVKNGCPIVFVARLLGNTVETTENYYLHFRDQDVREADQRYRP